VLGFGSRLWEGLEVLRLNLDFFQRLGVLGFLGFLGMEWLRH